MTLLLQIVIFIICGYSSPKNQNWLQKYESKNDRIRSLWTEGCHSSKTLVHVRL